MKITIQLIACCLLLGTCACKQSRTSQVNPRPDTLTIDSSNVIKEEYIAYVFFDSVPVFDLIKEEKIIDYLYVGEKVKLDDEFEKYNRVDLERLNEATFSYYRSGKKLKGKTLFNNFALRVTKSKIDSSLLYMGNLIPGEYDSDVLRLRTVRNGNLVFDTLVYSHLELGHDLDLHVLDSTTLANAGEVVYVNAWLGFGDFQNHAWYFSYKTNRLSTIVHDHGRFDGESWWYSTVYLPVSLSGKAVLANFVNGQISRDSLGRTNSKNYPAEIKDKVNQLIYIEELSEEGREENNLAKAKVISQTWFRWNGVITDTIIKQ